MPGSDTSAQLSVSLPIRHLLGELPAHNSTTSKQDSGEKTPKKDDGQKDTQTNERETDNTETQISEPEQEAEILPNPVTVWQAEVQEYLARIGKLKTEENSPPLKSKDAEQSTDKLAQFEGTE